MTHGLEILSIVIAGLSLLLTSLLSFFVIPMSRRSQKIETLEADVRALAQETIGKEMQLIRSESNAVNVEMRTRVTSIESRLLAGDAHMKRLDDRDHSLEVKVLEAISELKDVVATKNDLQRLREEITR